MFTGIAKNLKTGEKRPVGMTEDTFESILFDCEHDECSGPCECYPLEQDGVCPNGWPSKSLAVGMI